MQRVFEQIECCTNIFNAQFYTVLNTGKGLIPIGDRNSHIDNKTTFDENSPTFSTCRSVSYNRSHQTFSLHQCFLYLKK